MMTSFNSITNFLKKYYKQVTIGLLVLFVLYWLIFILTPSVKMSGVAVQEIQKLDEEIGTIKLEQNILYTEIQQYEEQLQGMDENISQINYNQNKISGEYGEKIKDEANTDDNLEEIIDPNTNTNTNNSDIQQIKNSKKYTPINSYKPSGKLVYSEDLLNKIENKIIK